MPASSKHSLRAATKNASPPVRTPRISLACSSDLPAHTVFASSERSAFVDLPSRKDVGTAHEVRVEVPPEHADLETGGLVSHEHDGRGVAGLDRRHGRRLPASRTLDRTRLCALVTLWR